MSIEKINLSDDTNLNQSESKIDTAEDKTIKEKNDEILAKYDALFKENPGIGRTQSELNELDNKRLDSSDNELVNLKTDTPTDSEGNVYPEERPENDGFEDDPEISVLKPGTIIERYGSEQGRFTTEEGTPHNMLGLPTEESKPQRYEVIKPVEVWEGVATSAHGDPGGATQYEFRQVDDEGKITKKDWDNGEYNSERDSDGNILDDKMSIDELINKGYLNPLD